jgi:hypothetical protein
LYLCHAGRDPFISFQPNAITRILYIARAFICFGGAFARSKLLREFLVTRILEYRHLQFPNGVGRARAVDLLQSTHASMGHRRRTNFGPKGVSATSS